MTSLSAVSCSKSGCDKPAMSEVIDLCRGHHDKRHDELLLVGRKVCTACGAEKTLGDFSKAKEKPSGVRSRCRSCEQARSRAWKAANPEYAYQWREANRGKWNSYRLMQQFGITQSDVDRMNADQGGKCAICLLVMEKPNVDHCHETGKVRALLCRSCNLALGFFRDDTERMRRAIEYVRGHRLS